MFGDGKAGSGCKLCMNVDWYGKYHFSARFIRLCYRLPITRVDLHQTYVYDEKQKFIPSAIVTEPSKKQQLYEAIRANPFISQQELANLLGLSRSAVAGYIAGLIRERKLLGRAYVLPDRRPIVCVGAANLDRKLRSCAALALHTSNPASQSESFGGVARNIAENLARLGSTVALLTAIGADSAGAALLDHAAS